jgi:hypothetical protein
VGLGGSEENLLEDEKMKIRKRYQDDLKVMDAASCSLVVALALGLTGGRGVT